MPIKETDAAINKWIEDELKEHFTKTLEAAKPSIENRVRFVVINAIKAQPEYNSLLSGRLLGEFGLTEVNNKLDSILEIWSKDITSTVSKAKLTVEMIQRDFDVVLSSSAAKQITNKGETLEWLDWLLMQGDKTIIREYELEPALGRQSRTGLAVMIKGKGKKWGVPSQYAGTKNANWVVRAINDINETEIENAIIKEVTDKW